MFCFRCGASMPDEAQVCPQCAAPVASAQPPRTPQAPQPPPSDSPWLNPPPQSQYPPQVQYPPEQYPGQYYPQRPPTDGKATASLVFGILSILCFLILAGIPAIILGHLSRADIKRSMGRLLGDGMALAGLIMGYISIGLTLLIVPAVILPEFLHTRTAVAANESEAASTVRTINTSQITYETTYPERGFARDLATLGPGPSGSCEGAGTADHACLLDNNLARSYCTPGTWCTKSRYKYSMSTETNCEEETVQVRPGAACEYVIVATPANVAAGRRTFCSTSDGVVRYTYGTPLFQPISAGECARWSPIS